MGYALAQLHRVQVAQIDAAVRQRLVELHHHRLVFGTDGTDDHGRAVLKLPFRVVLGRIGTDGRLRQLLHRRFRRRASTTRASSARMPSRRREQRVDVDLLDPGLLDHKLAEPDHQLFERGDVHRLAAPHALQRLVDPGLLHHPAGQAWCSTAAAPARDP